MSDPNTETQISALYQRLNWIDERLSALEGKRVDMRREIIELALRLAPFNQGIVDVAWAAALIKEADDLAASALRCAGGAA